MLGSLRVALVEVPRSSAMNVSVQKGNPYRSKHASIITRSFDLKLAAA